MLFHAGGRTDGQTHMTRLPVTFPSFANAPKNWATDPAKSTPVSTPVRIRQSSRGMY